MATKRKHPVENDDATSSKAQKLENDWSMGLFDYLCEELKEMVFDYLPGKDLLNLASCNKALNEYVGNKSRYMKKIVVTINRVDDNWITPRKYENLIFNERMSDRHIKFFDDASKRIKNIAFNCYLPSEISDKLLLLNNLESLKIENLSNLNFGSRTVNMPSLKSLVIRHANNSMKAFANCKLKNLQINRFSENAKYSFEKLIENQTELERFHLGVADWFFEDTLLFDAPFKLTELSLTYRKFEDYDEEEDNFLLFINKHRDTLKTVRCTNIDLLSNFYSFEKLRNVELTKYYAKSAAYDMSSTARFDQVQKLDLICGKPNNCYKPCFKNLGGIENKFQNMRELTIHHGKTNKGEIFSTLTNLKKLTFINTEIISILNIPKVEDLTFVKCSFPRLKCPIDFCTNNIQKLKIHRCAGLEWVHAYLKHPRTTLAIFDASPAGEFEEYAVGDKIKKFIRN